MSMGLQGAYGAPGLDRMRQVVESALFWGRWEQVIQVGGAAISGAARDAGNTPTTVLRPGLLLGRITASGLLKEWNPAGTDGSQEIVGVLLQAHDTQAYGANFQGWIGFVMLGGLIKSSAVIVPGAASAGITQTVSSVSYEYTIRQQLRERFMFDDQYQVASGAVLYSPSGVQGRFRGFVAKTGNYTVVEKDHDICFTNLGASGSVTFTLPTPQKGLRFAFYAAAEQDIVIAGAAGDILIGAGDAAADNITLGGTSLGSMLEVVAIDGTNWIVIPHLITTVLGSSPHAGATVAASG